MGQPLRKSDQTADFYTGVSSTSGRFSLPAPGRPKLKVQYETTFTKRVASDRVIQKAVRNHLRFLRSLGKTRISAYEVARALDLSVDLVKKAAVQAGAILED